MLELQMALVLLKFMKRASFKIMIQNQLYNSGNEKDHNSEFLLKIMNRTLMEEQTNNEKEL